MCENADGDTSVITSLAEVFSVVGLAAEGAIGPSASRVMYFSAKDLGIKEGRRLDHTDDMEQALRWVLNMEDGSWSVVFWKELGEEEIWSSDGKHAYLRILVKECLVRDVCMTCGIPIGGTHCYAVHGYWAGLLESIFSRKIDLYVEHAGFGSCLLSLRTTPG